VIAYFSATFSAVSPIEIVYSAGMFGLIKRQPSVVSNIFGARS
jgi:hypothetical protein